ncbi:MAG: chromosome segregation protein SMC [Acidobacteria bacterium]|nr:chromosome segregation protein SMC [Acidobacteriota bacterium]
MFRLEKVFISGFKSFCDPAELSFPERLTAVVGPNGCGKSNISDAILWVLGERRASHLRGDKMENIIFQGSSRRRALGMGEVELTLSTENGHPAAENGKLTIHRRVFRSGESEFRLNGKRVRLKEIADILMDTGLGIRNYSVMEQGKIDLILSNKPQDRRKLIEEAAGITSYKAKRRAAELKLDETQANLLRIDDTLSEMTRSLNSLKRQASRARRYDELASRLSEAKRSLYAAKLIEAKLAIETAAKALDESRESETAMSSSLQEIESNLTDARKSLAEKSALASRLRDELSRLNAEAERVRTFIEESEKSVSDLTAREEAARAQIGELDREAGEQQELVQQKSTELASATETRDRLKAEADALEQTRQSHADQVRRHERAIAEARENLMLTIARISDARNQSHQIDIAVEKCEFYLGKLDAAAQKVSEERDSARSVAMDWEGKVRATEQRLVELQRLARAALDDVEQIRIEHESSRESLAQSRDLISQTTYKIDSLRTLITSLEAQEETVRGAILEIFPHAEPAVGTVRAESGYEAALDTALSEIMRAVLIGNTDDAISAVSLLNSQQAGRGAFVRTDFRATPPEHSGLRSLASVIVGEGTEADAVRAAVGGIAVTDTLEEALALSSSHPGIRFVAKDGSLVHGSLVAGGSRKESRGVFTVKRELEDLESTIRQEKDRSVEIDRKLTDLEHRLSSADDARILAEERARRAETELQEMRAARDNASTQLQRFERDFETTSEERSIFLEEKQQLAERKARALEELRALEANESEMESELHEHENALRTARGQFEESTDAASHGRVELEAATGRLQTVRREHENLARLVHSLQNRRDQLGNEIENLQSRIAQTTEAITTSQSRLEELDNSLSEGEQRRVAWDQEIAELEARVAELDENSASQRSLWNETREGLFEAERAVDRANSRIDHLREQIQMDLHVGIESLAEIEPPQDQEARVALEEEVAALTEKIDKLGPVNVLAIEEYEEIEEREGFLRTQRDDLVQAIESLRTTIRKTNATSRELFREAFAAVNENFGKIFVSLFGGGSASMQLLDEDDILESGIEIHAQPAGKKTQIVGLLSGGERALTALALLFAIFRYKPSPFCILDEVDAPLDEVNNERFVKLLRAMAHDTQFVVITHSKRTMEAADVLYGVTMEEAGCSKLVSVSFSEVEGGAA